MEKQIITVNKICKPSDVYTSLDETNRKLLASGSLANTTLYTKGVGNLNAKEVMELSRIVYKLEKVNSEIVVPTKHKGLVKLDKSYLGYYLEVKGIKCIRLDVNCDDKVFEAKVLSAKSLIRRYSDQEWKRPYKWNADMKVYDIPMSECDGVDVINYKSYMDREIYIDLVGKTKPYHIQLMQKHKLHYKVNGYIAEPFIKSKGEPTPFDEAYMKVYAVDEVDAEHFFIKQTKDNLTNPEVILDTFAGVYTYESFRDDMYRLGFSDVEINSIGRILMNAIRFVDQIEPLYEDSTEE